MLLFVGRKFLLKPAKFQQSTKPEETNGKSSENGNVSTFLSNNPFLKCEKDEQEMPKHDENSKETDKSDASSNDLFKPAKSNLFSVQSSALSENSNFVFGQNLHERVVIVRSNKLHQYFQDNVNFLCLPLLFQDKVNSSEEGESEKADETASGGGDLFSAALTKSKSPEKECSNDSTQESTEDKTKKLVENAKNYEEMKSAQKRKFEEVQLTTGEEDEKNILEINCKLFAFIENNYEERGRGTLRLNDSKDNSYSRVVFRSTGSYRVLLNTKVFRDQTCETPSHKSLRLTAVGSDGVVKIFLVMGRPEDITHLHEVFSRRIDRAKERPENKPIVDETPSDSQQSDIIEPETKKAAISPE